MLNIADVCKQGCLESEAILGHVNIKKEKCSEELPNVLSKNTQEPAEYKKETCLSSVVHNSSTDLLKNKTEDLIISSLSVNDPVDCVVKVELDEVHNRDETILESYDDENYTEELENELEHNFETEFRNSEKLISMKKDYDNLIEEGLKSFNTEELFCALCKENFFQRDKYIAHLLSHHDPKNFGDFECDLCGKKFKYQYTFKKHLRTHVSSISTNKTCDREYKFNLTKHVQNGKYGQYTCTGCEKSFLDKESLQTHEAEHIEGASTTKKLKFGDDIREITLLKTENPGSYSLTTTITNPEQKSEEDKSLNIDKNERPTHKVKLENIGKEHMIETNQLDCMENRASSISVEYYPDVTKFDNNMSCNTEKQPTSSSNYGVLYCNICEYITNTSRHQFLNSHMKAHAATTRYSCYFCLYITTELKSLNLHVTLHRGETPYFCNVCDEKFSQKRHLDVHVLLHTGKKPYFCNECDKTLFDKSSLDTHLRLHTVEKPYSCNVCDKKYIDKCSLDKHVMLHTGEKPYSCNVCDKEFSDKSSLKRHVRLHTDEKPYACNVCDKKYSEKSRLDKHVRLHTGEEPYSCNICAKKFSDGSNFNRHVRIHTGKTLYSCNICDKKLSDKSSLNRHVRLHTDEKPYSCNVCDKKYIEKSSLDKHLMLHTGEKPYSCNVCDKKFSQRVNLDVHVKLHTGEKSYSCNVCDKKFFQKRHLQRHVELHTGKKPYSCSVCDKKFSDKYSLNRHLRLHTGEKPHSCNACGKKFSDKSGLDKHARSHTGEKPYCCNECDKKYSDKRSLDKHVRLHTREKP